MNQDTYFSIYMVTEYITIISNVLSNIVQLLIAIPGLLLVAHYLLLLAHYLYCTYFDILIMTNYNESVSRLVPSIQMHSLRLPLLHKSSKVFLYEQTELIQSDSSLSIQKKIVR